MITFALIFVQKVKKKKQQVDNISKKSIHLYDFSRVNAGLINGPFTLVRKTLIQKINFF